MSQSDKNRDRESPNDNYSLEEMLQELQDRPEDIGELVTRADGTIAYKVKKRKRRSEQPRKEAAKKLKKLRLMQLGIAFFLLVAIVLSAAGMLFYVNSSGFRDKVFANIQKSTGADIRVIQFSVQPTTAQARELTLEWPAGNHLRKLDVKFIEASLDVATFFQKRWGGQSVTAKNGSLQMKMGESEQPRVYEADLQDIPFNFKSYRCEKMRFEMLAHDGKLWSFADDVEASFAKTPTGSQLRLIGGQLNLNNFGQFYIDRSQIVFEQGLAKFNRLALGASKNDAGLMILAGDADLYSPEPLSLDVTLEQFPLSKLMAHGLGGFFKGTVDTSRDSLFRYVRFQMGSEQNFEIKTSFSGSASMPFSLIALPFLQTLSRELATQEIINGYKFDDKCEGLFVRNISSTALSNLDLADEGKFAIRGNISSDGKKIQGDLFVGLGGELLNSRSSNPDLRKVFQTEDNGYFWTAIKISGSPAEPMDDLENKMKSIRPLDVPISPSGNTDTTPNPEDELE